MNEFISQLKISGFKGDIDDRIEIRDIYSHDASLLEVKPELVVFPKDAKDISTLVTIIKKYPEFYITPRAAGTCMTGGAIGESVVMDTTRYMNDIGDIEVDAITVMPGAYYRDVKKVLDVKNMMMPAFPASAHLCAVGGMFGNNCAGEKTLLYGKAEDYIVKTKIILDDACEYEVFARPMSEIGKSPGRLGEIEHDLFELYKANKDIIKNAKPNVSKNSSGYYIWNIFDRDNDTYDLNKLLVGSQGTLGIITSITWKLVTVPHMHKLCVISLPDLKYLGNIVSDMLPLKPSSIESFDKASMMLALKFSFDFVRMLGLWGAFKMGISFIPELIRFLVHGIPPLMLLVEFEGSDEKSLQTRIDRVNEIAKKYNYYTRNPADGEDTEKYWRVRHESFNLLRNHIKDKRTAPFIDDVIIKPEFMPEFLPKLTNILDSYKLEYTIAGHAGNGNFHIIPLMDFKSALSGDMVAEISEKVFSLVVEYKGSLSAEHNDGIIRTPYLHMMFSGEVLEIFQNIKDIFDSKNIFNRGKKVNGDKLFIKNHIRKY